MLRILSAVLGFGALCCLPAAAQSFFHTHGHQGQHSHDTTIYVTHGTCCQQTVLHCGQAHTVTTHSHAHDSRGHHSAHQGHKHKYAHKVHKGRHGHPGHVKYTPHTQHHNVRVYSAGHSQAYHQSRYTVHGSTLPTTTLAPPVHPAPRRDLILLRNDRAEPWVHYTRGWDDH